jgi:hypothetical protein
VVGIIDLAETKIVDPTVFAVIFLPRRIWSRFLVARVSSSQHFLVAAPPVREHPGRRRFLVPVSETLQVVIEGFPVIESFVLLPWTVGRYQSPRFVTTREESSTRGRSARSAFAKRPVVLHLC